MRNPLRKSQGFTIIEILVVVAIMAILAGISIPQYQKMVNKGNQQGAVAGLTSIYMAEKNFAAENHSYTTCIGKIGITPQPGKNYYAMGFSSGYINASCGSPAGANCNTYVYDDGAPVASCAASDQMIPADTRNNLTAQLPDAAHQAMLGTQAGDMTNSTFTARAIGNVGSASAYDQWTIDQGGTPQNTSNNI